MIISLVLVLVVTASGTVTTYLYDQGANFASRLCAGACTGLAALGLVGFVLASFLGLTPFSIFLTVFVVSLPFLTVINPLRRQALTKDLEAASQAINRLVTHPWRPALAYFLFYLAVSVILWIVFSRAMFEIPDGIYTGLLNNFGDLPFHISVITSFAFGNNYPPEDPTYAGVKFTYPFLSDFVSAIFVRCGADLRQSMFIENYILGVSFVGLLHRWALEMLRDRLAAIVTPLLVLLNGGFGWILLWEPLKQNGMDVWGALQSLPPSFTIIPETTWRWGNAISTLLVPQRGMLLGLPLAVIVFTQWWMSAADEKGGRGDAETGGKRDAGIRGSADGETGGRKDWGTERRGDAKRVGGKKSHAAKKVAHKKKKDHLVPPSPSLPVSSSPRLPFSLSSLPLTSLYRMVAAGIVAGLLPLAHAHSFVVVMVVGACIALIKRRWLDWIVFFVVASLIALPQMWWSTHNSAVSAASFFDWHLGWDSGKEQPVWFWVKNTGLFIPLLLIAILWRGKNTVVSRRLLFFYLPFTLCFIIPNLITLAPWVWDNIKILYYWWLASAPLVALLLARLWRQGPALRVVALALFASVILAGSLDVAAIVLGSSKYRIFDRAGVEFAEIIKRETPPQALIIHAPVHNHPVFLTGRRSLMGYPGHIWTHGLDYVPRESEIKRFYAGSIAASQLESKNRVTHAVVSPLERNVVNVNEQLFSRFTTVGATGGYRLYQVSP